MLIQIDERNIINPEKIVHIVLKEITYLHELEPFETVKTHVVRIYFDEKDFIDCDIKLEKFSALMNRFKEKIT